MHERFPTHKQTAESFEPKRHIGPSLDTAHMYVLPDNPPLTAQDIIRYRKSRVITERHANRITHEDIRQAFESNDIELIDAALHELHRIPEDQRTPFLQQAAQWNNSILAQAAMELITLAPESDRSELIRACMDNEFGGSAIALPNIQHIPASERFDIVMRNIEREPSRIDSVPRYIEHLTTEERRRIISFVITHADEMLNIQNAIRLCKYLTPQQASEIVHQLVTHDDERIRSVAMNQMEYIPESERADLVEKMLEDPSEYIRRSAIYHISVVPETQRERVWNKARQTHRHEQSEEFAPLIKTIKHLPLSQRLRAFQLMEQETATQPYYIQAHLTWEAHYLPQPHFLKRMEEYVRSTDTDIRRAGATQLQCVSDTHRQIAYARTLMHDEDSSVRNGVLTSIEYLPTNTRAELMETILRSDNHRAAASALKNYFHHIPHAQQKPLIHIALHHPNDDVRAYALPLAVPFYDTLEQTTELDNYVRRAQQVAQNTPLYSNVDGRFLKAQLKKTGSQTTLLDVVPGQPDNTLKERVIIRHIMHYAYEAWKKAYEAEDVWRELGFDYVPIEPIVKVKPNKKTALKTDVYTRVINGPSADMWQEQLNRVARTGDYPHREHIETMIDAIKEGLERLEITHGHAHTGNFVLCFQRDKTGKPDITKPPRVYVIDFDAAASSGT